MGIVHVQDYAIYILNEDRRNHLQFSWQGWQSYDGTSSFLSVRSKLVLSCKQKTGFYRNEQTEDRCIICVEKKKKHNYVSKIEGAAHK